MISPHFSELAGAAILANYSEDVIPGTLLQQVPAIKEAFHLKGKWTVKGSFYTSQEGRKLIKKEENYCFKETQKMFRGGPWISSEGTDIYFDLVNGPLHSNLCCIRATGGRIRVLCPENGLNLFSRTKSGQLKCDLSVSFDEPGTEHIIRMTYEGQCLKVMEHLIDTTKKIDTCVVSRLCKISDQTDPNMEQQPTAMDTNSQSPVPESASGKPDLAKNRKKSNCRVCGQLRKGHARKKCVWFY